MTTSYFLTFDQFQNFRAIYRKFALLNQNKPQDILLYNIVRNLPMDRGFTNITNGTKIANGADPSFALKSAKTALSWGADYGPNGPYARIKQRYPDVFSDLDIAHILKLVRGA